MSAKALEYIDSLARMRSERARSIIRNILAMANVPLALLQAFEDKLLSHARVSLHFHPDRIDARGLSVAQGLLHDGEYRSQFETHISNGLLSPMVGGPRDHWENQLFGNSYCGAHGRPKYGALDFNLSPNGPASRFGSCYLLCRRELTTKASFCYLDSYRSPLEQGSLKQFDDILAAMLSEAFERHYGLGISQLEGQVVKPKALLTHLNTCLGAPVEQRLSRPWLANLDHYIEAQIHGDVSLYQDVDYLIADPSFKASEIETQLRALCDKYQITLLWHCGRELTAESVPDDFRGPAMPSLAERVAVKGIINAHIIGQAVASLFSTPQLWRDRGNKAHVLQELKYLWHLVVKFGQPRVC